MEIKRSNEELIHLIQQGDNKARDEFVAQNTPLVYSIVKRFHRPKQSQDDLFQIGCVGLMKALNHFDVSYGVKFSTYAVPIEYDKGNDRKSLKIRDF